jgi:hypothetical protein
MIYFKFKIFWKFYLYNFNENSWNSATSIKLIDAASISKLTRQTDVSTSNVKFRTLVFAKKRFRRLVCRSYVRCSMMSVTVRPSVRLFDCLFVNLFKCQTEKQTDRRTNRQIDRSKTCVLRISNK